MKILVTGGHVTPALAVIDELLKIKNIELVFVGRKKAVKGDEAESFEFKLLKLRKIKFVNLDAGKLNRLISFETVFYLLKIPHGFYNAFKIIKNEKPDLILSFGGYLALPVAVMGAGRGIPIYTHEQTLAPGTANIIIGLLAKKVFVGFNQTKAFFKKDKTLLTGNPLRKSIFSVKNKPFSISGGRKVIYITGGSLGSHSINIHVEKILHELLKKYIVIHQCGDASEYGDYKRLLSNKSENYFVSKHFFDEDMGYIYDVCDLVVSRSGASTICELIALKKPAVLIPLPWSANQEQKSQAIFMKKAGVAEIFNQEEKSSRLIKLIDDMFVNIALYKKNFSNLDNIYHEDAASKITHEIVSKK